MSTATNIYTDRKDRTKNMDISSMIYRDGVEVVTALRYMSYSISLSDDLPANNKRHIPQSLNPVKESLTKK